jgi:hypothetical protein
MSSNSVAVFQRALLLIQEEDYEQAKSLLKSIELLFHDHVFIAKIMGHLEFLTGNPVMAMSYLESLIPMECGVTEDECKKIREVLPVFESLEAAYQSTILLIREERYDAAFDMWIPELNKNITYHLPLEYYKLALHLLIYAGRIKDALGLFNQLPAYVRRVADMRSLSSELTLYLQTKKNEQGYKRLLVASGTSVSFLLILAVSVFVFLSEGEVDENPKIRALEHKNNQITMRSNDLNREVARLNSQIQQLSGKSEELQKAQTINKEKVHIVAKGENLWSIARRYYDDGDKWGAIWNANRKSLIDSDARNEKSPGKFIEIGTELLIP